jgi:hypothetical protein
VCADGVHHRDKVHGCALHRVGVVMGTETECTVVMYDVVHRDGVHGCTETVCMGAQRRCAWVHRDGVHGCALQSRHGHGYRDGVHRGDVVHSGDVVHRDCMGA